MIMGLFDPSFPVCEDDQERLARFRLSRTPRVGPISFSQLIQRFGSAQEAILAMPRIAKTHPRRDDCGHERS